MQTGRYSTTKLRHNTILAVEDNIPSQRLLRLNLEPLGYRMLIHGRCEGVLEDIEFHQPDLVLLDLNLPDGSGFDLCHNIRQISEVPIFILSGYGQTSDKARAFNAGADDYLVKPYDPTELAARVEAILRRVYREPLQQQPSFHSGSLEIDYAQRRVTVDGAEVQLSRIEYRLLEYLARNARRTIIADALLSRVWGHQHTSDYALLHKSVSRLRTKLGDHAHAPRFIVTKPGVGYLMMAEDENRSPHREHVVGDYPC